MWRNPAAFAARADGGKTWTSILRQGSQHFVAYLSPTHPGWIYATLCEEAPTYGLFLSKDNGKTFAPLKGMPFDNAMRVSFDPADASIIYVSTFGGSVCAGRRSKRIWRYYLAAAACGARFFRPLRRSRKTRPASGGG